MMNVKRLKLGFQLNFARENGLVKIAFFYPVERSSGNLVIKAGERSFSDYVRCA
jgi:DNA-binding transcriptional regulator LsrR (DeoR family)